MAGAVKFEPGLAAAKRYELLDLAVLLEVEILGQRRVTRIHQSGTCMANDAKEFAGFVLAKGVSELEEDATSQN
jgi:hypothetical protein